MGSWTGGILPNAGGGGSAPHTPKGPRAFDDLSILDMSSHGIAPVDSVVVTSQEQCMDLMVNGKYRPPLPIRTPAPWTTLMQACWAHDPRDRPEFNEVVAKLEAMLVSHPRAPSDFPCDVINVACYANPPASGAAVSRV